MKMEGDFHKVYKIVSLGDPGVGKTSVIVRHTEKRFDESYKMTIGTDISAKLMQVESKNIYLIIWDIGGQERYQILRDSYLQGSFGALLVFSVTDRESYNHTNDWLKEFRKTCGDIPAVLLANKIDLDGQRDVSEDEVKSKAEELGIEYLETSAKTGDNVDKAFELLVRKILDNEGKKD
ncbi:MAG: GTP-binding protein [Candidatus Lokiarchaeota archaeon]|nr:GTP-binding protein [Candidatus Lokiarchaeota archaeon]